MKDKVIDAMNKLVDDLHWSGAPLKVELMACVVADAVKSLVKKF